MDSPAGVHGQTVILTARNTAIGHVQNLLHNMMDKTVKDLCVTLRYVACWSVHVSKNSVILFLYVPLRIEHTSYHKNDHVYNVDIYRMSHK